MLHTHSSIYHQRCTMFFSQHFSFPCQYHSTNAPHSFIHLPPTLYNVFLPALQFPLSVSFHQCSILIHFQQRNVSISYLSIFVWSHSLCFVHPVKSSSHSFVCLLYVLSVFITYIFVILFLSRLSSGRRLQIYIYIYIYIHVYNSFVLYFYLSVTLLQITNLRSLAAIFRHICYVLFMYLFIALRTSRNSTETFPRPSLL